MRCMAAWDRLRRDCEGSHWRPAVRCVVLRGSADCQGIREPASAGQAQTQGHTWARRGRRRSTRAVWRLLVVFAVLAAGPLAVPVTASASCVGPELAYDSGQVRPGDTVRVVGQYWGDACFDTGPPPAGQGVLGLPRQGIEVMFEQGGTQTVVARGNADADYQFHVDIVIPHTAAPGEARLVARATDEEQFAAKGEPLKVVSAGQGSPVMVASFGPTEIPVPTSATAPTASRWPVFIVVALLIVGGIFLARRWRRSARAN